MEKLLSLVLIAAALTSFAGCGKDNEQTLIPPQHWGETNVRIETHPSPPVAGMSEIVVIATELHGRPAQDLIVSLRGSPAMPWVQAIQDGLIGVYRRAIDLGDGETAVLQVRLQRGTDEKILLFPLKLAAT
jgi:hypothetical protein